MGFARCFAPPSGSCFFDIHRIIVTRHLASGLQLSGKDSNPYKFSAWRNAALSTAAGSLAAIVHDTKTFDTNNNYDTSTGRYTAPIAGFYAFFWGEIVAATGGDTLYTSLMKNGTEHKRVHERPNVSAGNNTMSGAAFVQLAVSDYVQVGVFASGARSMVVGSQPYVWFNGYLVSAT